MVRVQVGEPNSSATAQEATLIQWVQSEKWVPDIAFGAFFALVLGLFDYNLQSTPGLIVSLLFAAAFIFFREFTYAASAFVLIASLAEINTVGLPTIAGFATALLVFVSAALGPRLWSLVLLVTTGLSGVLVAYWVTFDSPVVGSIAGISVYNTDGRTLAFVLAAVAVVGLNGLAWLLGAYLREFFGQRNAKLERDLVQGHNLKTMLEMAEQNQRFLIASDLNEMVLERVSAMLTLTDGARYAARLDAEVAPRTLDRLANLIRTTHDEMRRLYDMLNKSVQVAAAPPNINDVEVLAAQLRTDGYQTRVVHQGTRLDLSSSVELSIYRVIFDSVENVRKHAPANTEIDITFNWSEQGLQVLVKDNGIEVTRRAVRDGENVATADNSSAVQADLDSLTQEVVGPGITGMRERVQLFGGNLEAHAVPGVGFTMNAIFPEIQNFERTENN